MLAERCRAAETFGARLRGWLAHRPRSGEGLWLRPCAWIHTLGVPVPIDVVFCSLDGAVRRVVSGLRPARFAGTAGAAMVCELPAGGAAGVAPGDHLDLLPPGP